MDIGFILDSSGSLRNQYPQIKGFIQDFANNLDISKDGVHVGVVTFSFYATLSIKFSDYFDKTSFKNAVGNIPLMGSTTRIDKALKVSNDELFSVSNGARKDVPKILILLTDGSQTQDRDAVDPGKVAKTLRENDISIVTIGIGQGVNVDELEHIAGDKSRVYQADDFDKLIEGGFINNILQKSCETGKMHLFRRLSVVEFLIKMYPTVSFL